MVFRELGQALVAWFLFPGFVFLFVCAWAFEWLDRWMIARSQARVGPPWYQPLADLIKLLAKEDLMPTGTNEILAAGLPMLALASSLTAALYVPIAGRAALSYEGDLIVVLFLLSIPALCYFLAGRVTGGVYSLLGGNRSLLQYFSYEVPFMIALSGPAILGGSWSIAQIAQHQGATGWGLLVQPLGFLLAIVGLIGKLKRDPLDIPKAKSEMVGGSLTEYSGRKLALWHMSMNIQTIVGVFLLVNAFMGGQVVDQPLLNGLGFALRSLGILFALSFSSVLYARLRIDQLANLGWRVLAPLALLQILVLMGIGG